MCGVRLCHWCNCFDTEQSNICLGPGLINKGKNEMDRISNKKTFKNPLRHMTRK